MHYTNCCMKRSRRKMRLIDELKSPSNTYYENMNSLYEVVSLRDGLSQKVTRYIIRQLDYNDL